MGGIFGSVSSQIVSTGVITELAMHAEQRGRDSVGLISHHGDLYHVYRQQQPAKRILHQALKTRPTVVIGATGIMTNPNWAAQPVIRDGIAVFHDGIIINTDELWRAIDKEPELQVDSEILAALVASELKSGETNAPVNNSLLTLVQGLATFAAVIPSVGKLLLFSNNGSLYFGHKDDELIFASERYALEKVAAFNVTQVKGVHVFDIPKPAIGSFNDEEQPPTTKLTSAMSFSSYEEQMLVFPQPNFRRCTRCILPETMPFITFDESGVCNYCLNYKIRNQPRPREELLGLIEPYRRGQGEEVLVPFSGGRDSCYALHLIVNKLGLKPITYTYDWGLVTDLGQRNISRVSAQLGVENITVAANIRKKRDNVRRNLLAWLKKPHLGMISVLTAGDKHFFRFIETVKQQTGLQLNLWGINPLEVTHFKAGFLGVPPDFAEQKVYSNGALKQIRYQSLRLKAMMQSPGYFNRSLWDTLSGEYYRSFTKKLDYHHVFDYWRWDEQQIDDILLNEYDWERAPDTSTTWRIGDGTAAFYNYAYYTIAGFTEHDTFRSNQIREGQLTRDEALMLVQEENRPRYSSLKWYFNLLGVDYEKAIQVVNTQPRLYQN